VAALSERVCAPTPTDDGSGLGMRAKSDGHSAPGIAAEPASEEFEVFLMRETAHIDSRDLLGASRSTPGYVGFWTT